MIAHVPVMTERVLNLVEPSVSRRDGDRPAVIIDATLGLGGHAEAMLERFTEAYVVGIDRDHAAIAAAQQRLARFADRFTSVHAVYDQITTIAAELQLESVDAVLFDLGVSSMQLDESDRGFAYSQAAPLDMRMNREDSLTAAEILNTYPPGELLRVLRQYGEEKFASRIVSHIVARREVEPFETNQSLLDIIDAAVPTAVRRRRGHPAKRTFQALRIEVNDELGTYRRALPQALDLLGPGGRAVVLSYHSGEDRITKTEFAALTSNRAPRDLPVVPDEFQPSFVAVTRGAEGATDSEIATNRRATSVRLRAVEKLAA